MKKYKSIFKEDESTSQLKNDLMKIRGAKLVGFKVVKDTDPTYEAGIYTTFQVKSGKRYSTIEIDIDLGQLKLYSENFGEETFSSYKEMLQFIKTRLERFKSNTFNYD